MLTASRSDLNSWLDGLAQRYRLIAPRLVGDEPLYQPVTASADILFDFERTTLSPKSFLLPDTEVILDVVKRNGRVTLAEAGLEGEQVIFAIRPCDARGLLALDALLLDRPPADAYYAERRARTTLVGLACARLWDDCFCTSLGSGPDDASGLDVMLVEEETGYRVLPITEKGEAVLEGLAVEELEGDAPASDTSGEQVPVLPPEAWGALFEDPYWQRLAERCLSCHACTYVCPTCRCFDVRDDTISASPGRIHIQRLRAWDSCLAPGYRRIAGGHNPRPAKAQRLRNRYYCKFRTSPLEFGVVACVGCGRCIAVCPVGIDIAEMLADVAALGQ
jgi:sulfhydrogenase subunit beta (sulfur reductase)